MIEGWRYDTPEAATPTTEREPKKPRCKLTGADGNIFALTARAVECLKYNKQRERAVEMQRRVLEATSYEDALCIITDYVEAY